MNAARLSRWAAVVLAVTIVSGLSSRSFAGLRTGPYGDLVGADFAYVVQPRDTLNRLSSRYGVPVSVLASSNHLKPGQVLRPGQIVQIDDRHVVPQRLDTGILINIPQRLLFVFDDGVLIGAYPVALGRPSWPTPVGDFQIVGKVKNPPWIVPASIQRVMKDRGEHVITRIGPGPHNPLGKYAIFLSAPGYLIHGTDRPSSIYHFVSHGCIRLGAADIEALFHQVFVGEEVKIIYQPLSVTSLPDGRIFLESDPDIYDQAPGAETAARAAAASAKLAQAVNWAKARQVVSRQQAIALEVGQRQIDLASAAN